MLKKLIAIFTLTLLIAACGGEMKLDGSSPERFQESAKEMYNSLNPQEQEQFERAVSKIAFEIAASKVKFGINANDTATYEEEIQKEVIRRLGGKTAKQIIEMGSLP